MSNNQLVIGTVREIAISASPCLPHWITLMKRFQAGDIRAGVHAASSLKRWRRRHFPNGRATHVR